MSTTTTTPNAARGACTLGADKKPEPPVTRGRGRAFIIFFLLLAIAAGVGLYFWLQSRQFETTDDAEVEAHLNSISSRVDGAITRVYVDDNQIVKAGDPLVDLDPRDFQVSHRSSSRAGGQARSQVTAQRPNVPITQIESSTNISGAEADVANAEAAVGVAERDRESAARASGRSAGQRRQGQSRPFSLHTCSSRMKKFRSRSSIRSRPPPKPRTLPWTPTAPRWKPRAAPWNSARPSLCKVKSRLSQYKTNAPAQLAIRQANVQSQQANEQTAQAMLEQAELKLSYTKIVAPAAGIVLKRSAEVGERINAGQQLMMIAQIGDLWVTANFKETQMHNIHPGQSARIHVDALRQDFEGYVETIGGSTGAVASVLPPENATGNYVKVVQRIPVRLRFKPNQNGLDRLRPGMSVEPDVRIGR